MSMFTIFTDIFESIGLLLQLLWEEAVTLTEPLWRALRRFLLYGTLAPLVLFVLGFVFRSTVLLTLGGIFLCVAFVLVTLAFAPLISLIGKFLKKDDQAGSRFVKTILSIWLWELLTVFYCVVFPVWNDYHSLLLVALCALILSLASVVWGVWYITWFRKVLVLLVALVFVFCTLSFFLPSTATTIRKTLPNFDQSLNRLLSAKRANGDLYVADVNRDGYLDSLDVTWLERIVADPKQMPDSTRGDVNADGKIDSADVKYLVDYLYNGGWPPRLPKPKPAPVKPPQKSVRPQPRTPIQGNAELHVDTFTVAANTRFTGLIKLKQGQWFRVEAIGTWDCSGPKAPQPDLPCGPDGMKAPDWIDAQGLSCYPLMQAKVIHNLIGQIGASNLFAVNSHYKGIAPCDGMLMVGPNDYDFADNDGALNVVVSTREISDRIPESGYYLDTIIYLDTHKEFWTEYGIYLPQGATIQFTAEGQFRWDSGTPNPVVGPDGAPWKASTAGRPDEFMAPNANIVCLLARISDQVIPIGSSYTLPVSKGGKLLLGINERWVSQMWNDNNGTITVHLKVI